MTDKEIKEIVQALRCCAKGLGHDDACENCKVGEIQDRREYIEFAAANVIERLTAENAALREKVPQWISVEERRPEKQAWYHVAIRDKKTMRVSVEQDLYSVETAKNFGHEIGFCKANRWPEREELIAWMQFPSAPDAPGEGE